MMSTPSMRTCLGRGTAVGVLVGNGVSVGVAAADVASASVFSASAVTVGLVGTAVSSGIIAAVASAGIVIRVCPTAFTGTGSAVGMGVTPTSSSTSPSGTCARRTRNSPGSARTKGGSANSPMTMTICARATSKMAYFHCLLKGFFMIVLLKGFS